MTTLLKPATYTAIGVVVLGLLLVQTLLPMTAGEDANRYPEIADYAMLYGYAAVVAIGGVQVALLALGRLVSLATTGRVVGRHGAIGLAAITWALGASTAVTLAVLIHQVFLAEAQVGPLSLWLMIVAAAGTMATLVTLVVRNVLLQAIADRRELAEVI